MIHPVECAVSKPEQCSSMLQGHADGSLNLLKEFTEHKDKEDYKHFEEYCTAQGFSLGPTEAASGQQQDASDADQQELSGAPFLDVSELVAALVVISAMRL